jgi:hypothetical protein
MEDSEKTITVPQDTYLELIGQVELYRHHLNDHLEERQIPYEARLKKVETALEQARLPLKGEEGEEPATQEQGI